MRTIYTLIFLAVSNIVFAQKSWEEKKMQQITKNQFEIGCKKFDTAKYLIKDFNNLNIDTSTEQGKIEYAFHEDQKERALRDALEHFNYILTKPQSGYYKNALLQKAHVFQSLNQLDSARVYYKHIIALEKDKKKFPHAFDTSTSFLSLAEIEYSEKNYKKSLDYLKKSEEEGYSMTCGIGKSACNMNLAIKYAKNYHDMGNHKKAMEMLYPHLFYNGQVPNTEVARLAYQYLLEKNDHEYLKNEFDNALENYVLKPVKNRRGKRIHIKYLGREFVLNQTMEGDRATVLKKATKYLQSFEPYYKLINSKEI